MRNRLIRYLFIISVLLCCSISFELAAFGQDDDYPEDSTYYNVAAVSNGGQAFASSTHPSSSFPLSAIINGDRTGTGWGAGTGGWSDGTPNQFPDYLEIHFNGEKLINEIDVTTLQDNYQSPVEPTPETTFSLFGITDYNVGYFDSTTNQWVYVAYIRNSLKVMNQIKLSGVVRTQKLSIVILNARSSNYPNNYSRVVEVEAWGQDIPVVIPPPPVPGPSAAPSPCSLHSGGNIDPCELSRNLLSAMGGNRTDLLPYRHDNISHNDPGYRSANWTSQLDWTYNSWRNYGSQNKPLLAHALTLWRDPVEYGHTTDAAIDWWVQFLHCQTRDQQCTVTDPVMLQYFKGAELFSNTYDGDINLAVIATRYWAIKQIPTLTPGTTRYNQVNEVASQAGRYLRLTWALYALGSGKGPASRILNRYNHTDSPPYDNLSDQGCNGSSYNGPFLAMAGMRSTPMHPCEDNRARMLGHAINWTYRGNGADSYIEDIATFITQHLSASDPYAGNNAYGVDSFMSGILRRHIDGLPNPGEDTTGMIYDFLKNIRTAVPYNFVGATANGQEARLTLMEDNMNQETAPIFAVTYDYGQRLARILFPWSNHNNGCFPLPDRPWRKINVLGHADFKPNENVPTSVYATSANRGASSSSCKGTEYGLPIEEEFAIPSNWQWKYHIKFTPTGDAQRLR